MQHIWIKAHLNLSDGEMTTHVMWEIREGILTHLRGILPRGSSACVS